MAKAATQESVAASKREPQWRNAVQLMRGGIADVKARIGQQNTKIAEHWSTISSGYKVDKTGAKIFSALDKLEHEDRVNAVRALMGLIRFSDWPHLASDLVDQAEGEVIDPREMERREAKRDAAEQEIEDAVADVEEKAKPAPKKPAAKTDALAASKRHLKVVDTPAPAPSDDSDLAGED